MVSYPSAVGNGRTTTFRDQVRVYHQPGDNPNLADPVTLGKDALFLTCEKLDIVTRKIRDKSSQEMIADGQERLVNFQTSEFTGTSKTVKFDEATDVIIFEGNGNTPATIWKLAKVQGGQPQMLQGRKILYNRKTGEFLLDGVRVISSWLMPTERPTELFAVKHVMLRKAA